MYRYIDSFWENTALPALMDFIRIPNISPAFDPNWADKPHAEAALMYLYHWAEKQLPNNAQIDILRLPEKTPVLLINIPGNSEKHALYYGHYDKQPPASGWSEGLGPYTPMIRDGRLYGRGSGDDGYALFAAIGSILALKTTNQPHPHVQILIEGSEESGSPDLLHYIDAFAHKIHQPDCVICLDSGCGDYDRLWLTNSLRGLVSGRLHIQILTEAVHSGMAGGALPSVFQIMQEKLSAITHPGSMSFNLAALQTTIPTHCQSAITDTARILGDRIYQDFPLHKHTQPLSTEPSTLLRAQTWGNAYEIIGIDGIPSISDAGNVHHHQITAQLSVRIPPNCNSQEAGKALQKALNTNSPYGADCQFELEHCANGWYDRNNAAWLQPAAQAASQAFFEQDCAYLGEGGSIPFILSLIHI